MPVHEATSPSSDKFGIGVAVADDPLGPYTDHAGGPIVSQSILTNTIHNIDPTVHIAEDGRVYMWWGSFGNLRMVELEADMKTRTGSVQTVTGLTGFFEAPWVFERNGTYYLVYAGNNAGPTSACTPANYHACIAYGTASSPQGPWTYRGTILPPVSSTTSHPGIVEFDGQWYLAYHTADAVGGNHFRRSVAIDVVEWDDTQTPPRIKPVQITPEKVADRTPRPNLAHEATVTVSNTPVPTQYWVKSLNDEIIRPNPLPPDMWGTWSANRPRQQWAQYTWDQPVRVSGTQIQFWRDQAPGIGTGVSNPDSWVLQYWDLATSTWVDVPNPSGYPTQHNVLLDVTFDPVTTTQVRATFNGSPSTSTPTTYAAIAVQEWKVLSEQPQTVAPVEVVTWLGADDGPQLPMTAGVTYPGDVVLDVPVWWDPVDPADLDQPGVVQVQGSVLGNAGGHVHAELTVLADPPWRTNVALDATASASSTAGHNRVGAVNDDVVPEDGSDQTLVWGTWPEVGEQRVQYAWEGVRTVDRSEMLFFQDVAEGVDEGVKVPESWRLQYWDDGAEAWLDVTDLSGYGTDDQAVNVTTFEPVTTTMLRAPMVSQGAEPEGGSLAIREWRVVGEEPDSSAPTVALTPSGVSGGGGWFTSAVTVPVVPADDRDTRFTITTQVGDAEPVVHTRVRSADVVVSADGRHTVRVTVADQAGNEVDQSVEVAIDRLAPSTSAVVDQDARTVTLAASDATSGVVAVEYSVDSQSAWQPYTDPAVVDAYKHDVFYRATDAAGNGSAVATVTVPISPDAPMVGNIAPFATPTASYTAPWNNVNALNDGRGTNSGGSQGLLWGSWTGNEPVNRWIQYTWGAPVTVDSSEVMFWTDAAAGSGAGVAVPQSWYIEHWEAEAQAWVQVTNPSGYGTARAGTNVTTFDPVTTTRLRATLFTYPNAAGTSRSAVAVSEWEVVAAEVGEEPDTMAPTVGLATDPAVPGSGWFTGEVTVTATAEDDVDADPVVELRLGDGPWQPYAGPHVLSVDGRHVVAARATDASGNVSDEVELEAAIDTATPTTSAVLDPSARQATFASSDAGSGVARVEAHLGDEVWASVAGPLALPDDAVTVHFRAVDVAGNVETARHLERRGNGVLKDIEYGRSYFQDDVPVRDATVLRGHAAPTSRAAWARGTRTRRSATTTCSPPTGRTPRRAPASAR